jgi:hypothetical protein
MVETDKYQQNKANITEHNIPEACGIQLYKKLLVVTEPSGSLQSPQNSTDH